MNIPTKKILVNGVEHIVPVRRLDRAGVVRLSKLPVDGAYSVTYEHPHGETGAMDPRYPVIIHEGTKFVVEPDAGDASAER